MAGGIAPAGPSELLHRRQALAGKSGYAGLVENKRVFFLAVFASLGGLLYGYNQGVFSSVLPMYSFVSQIGDDAVDPGKKGWLVAILELGAWFGVLCSGYLADRLSRKRTIMLGTCSLISPICHIWADETLNSNPSCRCLLHWSNRPDIGETCWLNLRGSFCHRFRSWLLIHGCPSLQC
jgi:hypothetical protein